MPRQDEGTHSGRYAALPATTMQWIIGVNGSIIFIFKILICSVTFQNTPCLLEGVHLHWPEEWEHVTQFDPIIVPHTLISKNWSDHPARTKQNLP